MSKCYCVYDAKNDEQLLLVADTVKEVAEFVGIRKIYVLQCILRGSVVKKKYKIERIEI